VQKTAPLNFCTPPDQYQVNGELVLYVFAAEKLPGQHVYKAAESENQEQ